MPYYTHHTYKGDHQYVSADVLSDYCTTVVIECLIKSITRIRVLTRKCGLMCYHIALSTECLITHITRIRALARMYALMYYQFAPLTECLIMHTTQ